MPKTKKHVVPKVGTVFGKKYKGKYYKLTVVRFSGQTAFATGGAEPFKTDCRSKKHYQKRN